MGAIISERPGDFIGICTEPLSFERTENPRTTAPAPVGDGNVLRVASFNVLNYFTTLGERGAKTPEEFERQRAKIVAALAAVGADAVGLIEIENNGDEAVGNLVGHLNGALGASSYAFVADPPFTGTDAIKVAIIYRPDRVEPIGSARSANPADDPAYGVFDRPPLAQTFRRTGSGETFTVIVNHFKSKGSCPETASDPNTDQGDGQGCWNPKRVQQAEALLEFIGTVQDASGSDRILVIGDLNSYGEEDPIDVLRSGNLTDLLAAHVEAEHRYSYVFEGQAGYLDHALVTPALMGSIAGVTVWHINADEATVLDYSAENPSELYRPDAYRSSDHDPVVIGLNLGSADGGPQPPVGPTPDDYYASAEGLAGPALKAALHAIIQGHRRHSYSTVWDILMEADRDPADPNLIVDFYSGRRIPITDRDQGGNTPDFWNREHVWPNSHGFPNRDQHAFTDAHHLRASDKSINGDRGNRDFDGAGQAHDECSLCRIDDDSWEPPDAVKGDVARMLFYMAVRYDGTDGGTPDLELVDRTTQGSEPRLGHLCTLTVWHELDPVSATEQARNDVIFRWQDNRNPFIDHPEWVAVIWGGACG